jgi:hypothetical protein
MLTLMDVHIFREFINASGNLNNNLESIRSDYTWLHGYYDSILLWGFPDGLMTYFVYMLICIHSNMFKEKTYIYTHALKCIYMLTYMHTYAQHIGLHIYIYIYIDIYINRNTYI